MTRIRSIVLAFCVASGVVAPAGATIAPLPEMLLPAIPLPAIPLPAIPLPAIPGPTSAHDPMAIIQERLELFEGAGAVSCLNPDLRESFADAIAPENIGNLRARVLADKLSEFNELVVQLRFVHLLIEFLPNC